MYLARRLYLTFTATSCLVAEAPVNTSRSTPLPAYRLPSRLSKLTWQFGLVAPLGGRHHWETLSSHLLFTSNHIPHIQTVPLFTVHVAI